MSSTESEHAAIERIRDAMKRHAPKWTGLDTDKGLAASVDTFIETSASDRRELAECRRREDVTADLVIALSELISRYDPECASGGEYHDVGTAFFRAQGCPWCKAAEAVKKASGAR